MYIYIYIYISVYVKFTSEKVVACKYHSTITMAVPDPMLTRYLKLLHGNIKINQNVLGYHWVHSMSDSINTRQVSKLMLIH